MERVKYGTQITQMPTATQIFADLKKTINGSKLTPIKLFSNGEIITYKILWWLFYCQFYLLLKRIATLFNEKVDENDGKRVA
jgi:hypothetical protein